MSQMDQKAHNGRDQANARFSQRAVNLGSVNPKLKGYPKGASRGKFRHF